MRSLKFILPLIAAVFFINFYNAQTYVVTQLHYLLNLAATDSIQKVERLAGLKFHKIVNKYRKENKLDTMAWDDALWLTCKNHNVWMSAHNILDHSQKLGSKFFTGSLPHDRYKYATNGEGNCQWNGENALYNFEHDGNTVDEIAANIAHTSFEQWKHSPGHNSNMLGKTHKVHGVAFNFNRNGKVFGTDLFASNIDGQFNNLSNKNQLLVLETISPSEKVELPAKRVKLDLKKLKEDVVNKLYETESNKGNFMVKKSKAMEKASGKHSEYMCSVKKLTHDELKNKSKFYGEDEVIRMKKASHGFYFFKKRNKLTESIALVDVDAAKLDINQLVLEIQNQLNNEHVANINRNKMGYGLSIKRNKNNLKFYVTRIIGHRNEKTIENEKTNEG